MKKLLKKFKRKLIKAIAFVKFNSNDSFMKRRIRRLKSIIKIQDQRIETLNELNDIRVDRFNRVAKLANLCMDYIEKKNSIDFIGGSLERIILEEKR